MVWYCCAQCHRYTVIRLLQNFFVLERRDFGDRLRTRQCQIQQHVQNSQLNRTCLCPCQATPCHNLLKLKHSSVAEPSIRSLHLPSKQSASNHAGSLHSRTLRSQSTESMLQLWPFINTSIRSILAWWHKKSSIPSQPRTSPEPPPSLPICINAPTSTQGLTSQSLEFVAS